MQLLIQNLLLFLNNTDFYQYFYFYSRYIKNSLKIVLPHFYLSFLKFFIQKQNFNSVLVLNNLKKVKDVEDNYFTNIRSPGLYQLDKNNIVFCLK